MVMYYPYGATLEMGPTAILPNSSYLQVDPDKRVAMGKSGGRLLGLTETKLNTHNNSQACAVLIHFHLWHRGTKRLIEEFTEEHPARPMIKFQFFAPTIPITPTWNHDPTFLPFPNATLKILSSTIDKENKLIIHSTADLTIRGITNNIVIPFELNKGQTIFSAKGSVDIDRTLYNVKYKSDKFFEGLGDKMIYDNFTITFNLFTKEVLPP